MNNLKLTIIELNKFIEEKINNPIKLIFQYSKDNHIELKFIPKYKSYRIYKNFELLYMFEDLGTAIKQYWEITGENYE